VIETLVDLERALRDLKGSGQVLRGYLGYELAHDLEDLGPAPESPLPRLWFTTAAAKEPVLHSIPTHVPVRSSPGFEDAVARIVQRIHAGDLFQTNLCRYLDAPFDPRASWALFNRLPKQAHSNFLDLGQGRTVLSMSPETFLRVDASGRIESLPIKGTRPLTADPRELLASAKDRAELAMVVDVTRNDLSRVCLPGSVQVVEHAALMTLPTLYHTYSRVVGQLRPGVTPVDIIRATFPPASITGAPKIEAIKAAQAEERRSRGPCMGAIGWIRPDDGAMELSVAIRTAYTANGNITYLAGCGITAESVPAEELRESEAKAAAFLLALDTK
jgi:para-aminobenzoate synthetase component 1